LGGGRGWKPHGYRHEGVIFSDEQRMLDGNPTRHGLLIFETVLTDSATEPYDGLPVRRETFANSTDWKSVVQ
jgi:hypothetical protein